MAGPLHYPGREIPIPALPDLADTIPDENGWWHYVDYSPIFGKDMPTLYHLPCGHTWHATVEQAAKVKRDHVCERAK